MATVTTGTHTTKEVRNPTCYEFAVCDYAMHELLLHRKKYINGYDTGKFELIYCDFEHVKIMKYIQIVNEFMKKYPKNLSLKCIHFIQDINGLLHS